MKEIRDKITILNFIASKPLFSRFLKETGLRGYFAHNTASQSGRDVPELKLVHDDRLIISAFEWGAEGTYLSLKKWIYAHDQWAVFVNNPKKRKEIIRQYNDGGRY